MKGVRKLPLVNMVLVLLPWIVLIALLLAVNLSSRVLALVMRDVRTALARVVMMLATLVLGASVRQVEGGGGAQGLENVTVPCCLLSTPTLVTTALQPDDIRPGTTEL